MNVGMTLVFIASISITTTSCSRRVAVPQAVNVNVGGAGTSGKTIPTSRKEIRLMKKAQRKGVVL